MYSRNPEVLRDVALQDTWRKKASGEIFTANTPGAVAIQDLTDRSFQQELIDAVVGNSDLRLRTVHCLSTNHHVTLLLYREEQKLTEGYENPVRYSAAREVLVQLKDTGTSKVLTIKAPGQLTIQGAIHSFMEMRYGCEFSSRPDEPFSDYTEKEVTQWFKAGGKTHEGILVRVMAARTHNLKGNPVVAVETPPGVDAGKSFHDLVNQVEDLVDMTSLMDIARIEVEIGENGNTRDIVPEGNPSSEVMFKMMDNGVSPEIMTSLSDQFFQRFGLPLNQWIDHRKFVVGRAAMYDHLFACDKRERIPIYQRDAFEALRNKGYLMIDNVERGECTVCNKIIYGSARCDQHPTAHLSELMPEEKLAVNQSQVIRGLRTLLGKSGWTVGRDFDHRINTDTYRFIPLVRTDIDNNEVEVWAYPAFEGMSVGDLVNLQSLLTPVLILWVGKGRLSRQAAKVGQLPGRSIGELLAWDELEELPNELDSVLDELRTEYPSRIERAATLARSRLRKLLIPGPVVEYTPDQFEHDVYVLWKHMLPLTVQLGAQKRGQSVPDGILTYWMRVPAAEPAFFLYDAKLNINGEGYDLSVDEQRKAWDYITKARHSEVLDTYLLGKEMSGYVFVSNKYKDDDPEEVMAFIRTHTGWGGPMAFLTVRDLLTIHGYWLKYRDNLVGKENAFKKAVHTLLITAIPALKETRIVEVFHRVVTRELGIPAHPLNVDQFVAELTEGLSN